MFSILIIKYGTCIFVPFSCLSELVALIFYHNLSRLTGKTNPTEFSHILI